MNVEKLARKVHVYLSLIYALLFLLPILQFFVGEHNFDFGSENVLKLVYGSGLSSSCS